MQHKIDVSKFFLGVLLMALGIMMLIQAISPPKLSQAFVDRSQTLIVFGDESGEQEVCATVASSTRSMTVGLTDKTSIPDKTGLLYVYPKGARPQFWSKDMRFATEVWWIAQSKVVGISQVPFFSSTVANQSTQNTKDYKPVTAPSLVDSVLEVKAGTAKKLRMTTGQSISRETVNCQGK